MKGGQGVLAAVERLRAAQPKIFLNSHEGYYRHDDVLAVIVAFGVMNASLKQIRRTAQDQTIDDGVALDMIDDLAMQSVY